ncbi:hypothetical protein AAF712_010558 [Marasmius tenuissimus]|uniref:Uncharacterized protein n=1 Tax=Marasmius tenuissimus TaxID=585030 RepID=A0ABR2ZNE6_9AGAR
MDFPSVTETNFSVTTTETIRRPDAQITGRQTASETTAATERTSGVSTEGPPRPTTTDDTGLASSLTSHNSSVATGASITYSTTQFTDQPGVTETSETPTTTWVQVAGHKSSASATIGGAVGGAVGAVLIIVVVIVWARRSRAGNLRTGWIATGLNRRRRPRPNLQVTALPITAVEPEHVSEKTRERGRPRVDSPGPTITDDQRVGRSREGDSPGEDQRARARGTDSEVLAKLDMIMERVARSSPGPTVGVDDQRARGPDSEVLAKLDMIMERVARLEEADRDRDMEEAPPDYTSNRS